MMTAYMGREPAPSLRRDCEEKAVFGPRKLSMASVADIRERLDYGGFSFANARR